MVKYTLFDNVSGSPKKQNNTLHQLNILSVHAINYQKVFSLVNWDAECSWNFNTRDCNLEMHCCIQDLKCIVF